MSIPIDRFTPRQRRYLRWLLRAQREHKAAPAHERDMSLNALRRRGLAECGLHPKFGACWSLTEQGVAIAERIWEVR